MNTYYFYDKAQNMGITLSAVEELDAWIDLTANFGSCYIMDNIIYIGKNLF